MQSHSPACPPLSNLSGVLDDEDGYGEGATMEDYVTHDDVEDYDGVLLLPGCCLFDALTGAAVL